MASSRAFALAVAAGALVAVAACGGATETGLFGASGSSSGADASASGSSSGSSSSSSSGSSSGGSSGGSSGSSSGGSSGSSSGSSSGGHDAGTHDSGGSSSSGGDPGIACGGAECDPSNAVCCRVDTSSGGGTPSFQDTCTPASACQNVAAMPIPCDDAHDCGSGSVCCVTEDAQTGRATSVACVAPSSCQDQTQTWLCDPKASQPCPNGLQCAKSQTTIPGYDICRP